MSTSNIPIRMFFLCKPSYIFLIRQSYNFWFYFLFVTVFILTIAHFSMLNAIFFYPMRIVIVRVIFSDAFKFLLTVWCRPCNFGVWLLLFTPLELFSSPLADGLSLEFQWLHVVLKFPGLYSVFWLFSIMLLFGWSPIVRQNIIFLLHEIFSYHC